MRRRPLLAIAITVGMITMSATAAHATDGDVTDAQVAQFEQILDAKASDTVREQYESLSTAEQKHVVSILTSPDPFSSPDAEVVTSTSLTRTPTLAKAKSTESGSAAAAATTYDVTATYTVDFVILGIAFGYFKQVFRYQTGSNRVLKTYSCNGTFTGFSFIWAISTSNNRWVASGKGYCETIFTGHAVYKGSNLSTHKQMLTVTNGPGIVSRTLKNV
jgi:hypothetical protein